MRAVRRSDPARYYVAQSGWISAERRARRTEPASFRETRRAATHARRGAATRSVPLRLDRSATASASAAPTRSSAATTRSSVRDEVVNDGTHAVAGLRLSPAGARSAAEKTRHDQSRSLQLQRRGLVQRRKTSTRSASSPTSSTTARSTRRPPAAGSRCCSTTSSPPGSRTRQDERCSRCTTDADRRLARLIRELGPAFNVAPGAARRAPSAPVGRAEAASSAIEAQDVAGLDRAVDYGSFDLAVIAEPLFWLLGHLHTLSRQLGLVDHRPGGADQAGAVSAVDGAVPVDGEDAQAAAAHRSS